MSVYFIWTPLFKVVARRTFSTPYIHIWMLYLRAGCDASVGTISGDQKGVIGLLKPRFSRLVILA